MERSAHNATAKINQAVDKVTTKIEAKVAQTAEAMDQKVKMQQKKLAAAEKALAALGEDADPAEVKRLKK